jgi:hypothetical protein
VEINERFSTRCKPTLLRKKKRQKNGTNSIKNALCKVFSMKKKLNCQVKQKTLKARLGCLFHLFFPFQLLFSGAVKDSQVFLHEKLADRHQ